MAAASVPLWGHLIPQELSAKLPSNIRRTDLKTIIVKDKVYLKVFTNVGVEG
jgi:hypothetical protein